MSQADSLVELFKAITDLGYGCFDNAPGAPSEAGDAAEKAARPAAARLQCSCADADNLSTTPNICPKESPWR